MEPKIIAREKFSVIGYELRTSVIDGVNFKEIPEFWDYYRKNNLAQTIPGKKDETVELGICCNFNAVTKQFSYIIGFETDSIQSAPDHMILKTLPASTYAVFTTPKVKADQFPTSIQETTKYIYSTWLPQSGYEYNDDASDIEVYDSHSCPQNHEYVRMEIYIPVK